MPVSIRYSKRRDYEMDESIRNSRKRYRRLGSNIQTTTGDIAYAFEIEVTSLQTDVRCTHVHVEKKILTQKLAPAECRYQ